ncbi:MAG TPA: sulfotransferase domain-containing protein [Steroidobacteraceae bacterium]|nr:sulfotransferase domain-containing protein [Steroidobacteraceae bacterium]
MNGAALRLPGFIVGGTEKAGTTSVFDWLSAHPEVGTSSRKETDFFRTGWTGDPARDRAQYASYFEHCAPTARVLLEASPGYLGEADTVVPRLSALLPGARLLFILRDPIERLHSSYHFHRGRLNLPQSLDFDDYVRRCLEFDRGTRAAGELGLDEWYLKVLRFGRYAEFVARFVAALPRGHVKVGFFETLRADERGFMTDLSDFVGIDSGFWRDFPFRPSNVTFSARNHGLHRLAVRGNALAEPLMRRYPAVKQSLVRMYKALNQEREGYDPMPTATRELLTRYYAPSARALRDFVAGPLPPEWRYLEQARAAA